ncbi:MAG: hypothetical protein OXE84_02520 [Rhodobacteraceae bacterium]|nr:hypothetical protein [Paracoccaceae bacterium]
MLGAIAQDSPSLKPNQGKAGKSTGISMWVQEAVFGHRFVEEQLPFMLVLEVLAICRVLHLGEDGRPYKESRVFNHSVSTSEEHENFIIPLEKSVALRYILFKDRSLDSIANSLNHTPQERFGAWINELNQGFRNEVRSESPIDFSYLRKRFGDRFEDARHAVKILQGLELDTLKNRRYTSRFLVPRGANLILNDVDQKFVADRRFFGRGGEMIYLMINRSSLAKELSLVIREQFLATKDPIDRIAAKLIPDRSDRRAGGSIGYLPKKQHVAYDRIGEDWHAILKLKKLPSAQKFEPLFRMTALNLVRYFAERAQAVVGNSYVDPIPLDMLGGRNANLRDVSKALLRQHRQVIEDAVESFIRYGVESTPAWNAALKQTDKELQSIQAYEAIQRTFDTEGWRSRLEANESPEKLLSIFIRDAQGRSRNRVSTMITPLGTNSGFVVARSGVGTWFASSDDFLEALVLAVVEEPITTADFLEKLYERYGIVIGPEESRRAFSIPPCDISSFEENLRAFERRLIGLGYAKHLSDDCAFVSNIYFGFK